MQYNQNKVLLRFLTLLNLNNSDVVTLLTLGHHFASWSILNILALNLLQSLCRKICLTFLKEKINQPSRSSSWCLYYWFYADNFTLGNISVNKNGHQIKVGKLRIVPSWLAVLVSFWRVGGRRDFLEKGRAGGGAC